MREKQEEPSLLIDDGRAHDDNDGRLSLLAEYRRLVRIELPAAARAGRWILRLDHCFARVILDDVFGGCWYGHLQRGRGRSAESQLDAAQLTHAIAVAYQMLIDGDEEVHRLNARSLAWRGKLPHPSRQRPTRPSSPRPDPSEVN